MPAVRDQCTYGRAYLLHRGDWCHGESSAGMKRRAQEQLDLDEAVARSLTPPAVPPRLPPAVPASRSQQEQLELDEAIARSLAPESVRARPQQHAASASSVAAEEQRQLALALKKSAQMASEELLVRMRSSTCHGEGCNRRVFISGAGAIAEFCSNTCAAIGRPVVGTMPPSALDEVDGRGCSAAASASAGEGASGCKVLLCGVPGCSAPRMSGCAGYCSARHEQLAGRKRLLAPATADVELVHVGPGDDWSVHLLRRSHPRHAAVRELFTSRWCKPPHESGGTPRVQAIYHIQTPPPVFERFRSYASQLSAAAGIAANCVEELFHGTSQLPQCTFGVRAGATPCDSDACAICSICRSSLKLRHCGTPAARSGGWLRFGRGLYFSSCSGKSNDYSEGSEKVLRGKGGRNWRWRCMLLCKVAVGRAFETDAATDLDEEQFSADGLRVLGYDSVLGAAGADLNYPETVVYTEAAALPRELVVYTLPA